MTEGTWLHVPVAHSAVHGYIMVRGMGSWWRRLSGSSPRHAPRTDHAGCALYPSDGLSTRPSLRTPPTVGHEYRIALPGGSLEPPFRGGKSCQGSWERGGGTDSPVVSGIRPPTSADESPKQQRHNRLLPSPLASQRGLSQGKGERTSRAKNASATSVEIDGQRLRGVTGGSAWGGRGGGRDRFVERVRREFV